MEPTDYIEVDLKRLAVWQLERVATGLRDAEETPFLLIDVVRSSYLALQAALIHVLSGTAGIGALYDKDAAAMLDWLESMHDLPPKNHDRVMDMRALLKRATATGADIRLRPPISITPSEVDLLARLADLRDAIEHPKDEVHSFEVAYLVQPVRAAARVAVECLMHSERAHRLKQGEREFVENLERQIDGDVVGILTGAWAPAAF